jgi:transposase
MRSDLIAMTPKEIRRLEVLQRLAAGTIRQKQAAGELGLSIRQVKRAIRAYRQHGAASVVSQRRGRPGNRRRDPAVLAQGVALVRELYADFGPTLASQMLAQRHDIHIDRETLRCLLIRAHIWKPKRRKAAYHPPRKRRARFGELIQIDGSPHNWFEERGPRCTLLVFIDDATSKLVGLRFAKAESTIAYFQLAHDYFRRFGLPQTLYSDRHSIFRVNTKEQTGGNDSTHFATAMDALDIELICANSPQAKGRVERVNRTLQDRLTKELRLANISSIADANRFLDAAYLERHNAQFAVQPLDPHDAHRPLNNDLNLAAILAHKEQRKLTKDLTFSFERKIYQVLTTERRIVFPHALIDVITTFEGQFIVERQGRALEVDLVRDRPRLAPVLDAKELTNHPPRTPHKPPLTHPWKSRGLFQALGTAHQGDTSNLQTGDTTSLR